MGMAPGYAGKLGRLPARRRRDFLIVPGLAEFLQVLRTGEQLAPEIARPRLLDLARHMFEEAKACEPVPTGHFESLCAERGVVPEETVTDAVLRAAARPPLLPRPRPLFPAVRKLDAPQRAADPRAVLFRRLLRAFRLRLAERYVRAIRPLFMANIRADLADAPADIRACFGLPPLSAFVRADTG